MGELIVETNRLKRIEKILLFLVGVTFPLLQVRIDLGFYTVTAYMISLTFLLMYSLFTRSVLLNVSFNKTDLIIVLFLMNYCFSMFYSINQTLAITNFIKLLIVISIYFLLKEVLLTKPVYLNFIIKNALIALPLYMMFLAYRYIYVFNVSYIGMNLDSPTRTGKNSLAFMIAILIPFILTALFHNTKRKKILEYLSYMSVLIISFLIQSRGLVLTIILNFLTIILLKKGWKKLNLKFLGVLIIALIVFFMVIPDNIKDGTLARFLGLGLIFDSSADVSDLSESRAQLLQRGISIFRENPIIGVGAGSYMYYGGVNISISHNDYLLVLAEQGIIGFLIFVVLILSFVKMSFKTYMRTKSEIDQSILVSVIGITFYLLLINAYDNILLWTLFASVSARYTFVNNNNGKIRKSDL